MSFVFNRKQRELKVDTFKIYVLSSSLCNPVICCTYTIII